MSVSLATIIIGPLVLATYLAFGVYGIPIARRAERFRVGTPPKDDRWNAQYYAAEAEPWLRTNRRWERIRTPVWFALLLVGWLLIRLLSSSSRAP
jgi:hypothetical protein